MTRNPLVVSRTSLLTAFACMGAAACFSSSSGRGRADASFASDATGDDGAISDDGATSDDGAAGADGGTLPDGASSPETGARPDASPSDATSGGEAGPIATASGACVPDAGVTAGTPPATINFDAWPDGGIIAAGTLIAAQYPGVTFSSTACGGGTTNNDGEASSMPNFLVGNPDSFQPLVMDLATPVSTLGLTLISVGSSTVTATAYDTSLTKVLDSKAVTHPGMGTGFGAHDPITLSGAGAAIARVVVAITTPYPGDGFGIDDVTLQ